MKRTFGSAILLLSLLIYLPSRALAVGNDNPTGVTGAHNGQITTAGSMDPYTGNGKRSVTDLEVAGSVGAYPLQWTRFLNTRGPNGAFGHGWSHSYQWGGLVRFGERNGAGGGEDAYVGPDARMYYPDGRVVDFYAKGGGVYTSWLNDRPGDRLILLANGSYELQMNDGGVVVFIVAATHTFQTNTSLDLRAIKIVDPYQQETTLEYDASGALSRITEPGGRYLQVNYNPGLASVQAFSPEGALIETVSYTYQALTFQGTMGYGYLTQVNYADGAVASYTYQEPNVWKPYYGLIKTCNDVRFAGPMKKIEYEYMPLGSNPPADFGQLKAEKNATTHQIVSQVVYPLTENGAYLYDPRPYARTEVRGDGATRSFQYDKEGGGILSDFTDFKGQRSSLGYPYNQNITVPYRKSFTDARGKTSIDEFDITTGALLSVTSADGTSVSWTYSDAVRPIYVTSYTDERGFTTEYDRDATTHRIWRTWYPGGSSEEFYYNVFGQIHDHRLPSGTWEHSRYDGRGVLEREWNDADGWDNRKEYTYWQPGEAGGVPDMVKTVQDGFARARGLAYNTRTHYNRRRQITEIHYPATGLSPDPYVRYGYNNYGDRTSTTDELGHTTITDYDEYGRPTKVTEPLNVQNWNGTAFVPSRVREFKYDYVRNGVYCSAESHTSTQWRRQIDPAFDAAGNRRVTDREYDDNGRLTLEKEGLALAPDGTLSSPDAATQTYTYDAVGNKETYRDPMNRLTTYEYDDRNRLKKTIAPLNRITENWYDYAGNRTDAQFPDGNWNRWRNFDAFGQAGQYFDERNNQTDYVYERGPMKSLLSVTTRRDREGGGTEDQVSSFWSDGLGRPWRSNFPDGTYEETGREFGGLVTAWKNRKNQTKRLQYDNRGREDHNWWDNNAAPEIYRTWDDASRQTSIANNISTIDYSYDDANQVKEEGTTVAGSGGRVRVWYDRYPSGQPSHFIHPMGWWSRRDYTARGQLKAVGWDDGGGNWQHKLVDNVYYADSALWYGYRGNGAQSGYGYDGAGRLSIAHTHRASYYQNYSYRSYWRDSRDRIIGWQKSTDNGASGNGRENGRGERYEYDAEGQLNRAYYEAPDPANSGNGYQSDDNFGSWDGNWNWRGYDALGSRRGNSYQANQNWTWYNRRDNGLNQYTQWGPWAATYDDQWYGAPGNGVLMQDGWITASYNALNQPIAIYSPNMPAGQFTWFGYDPLGRCVKRWVSASGDVTPTSADFMYYDGWSLVQEGPSAATAEWIYFHSDKVDEVIAAYHFPSGGWNYYHYDGRGNVSFLTDWWGNLVEQYDYRAFGEPLFFDQWGNQLGVTQRGNRFLFKGREWLSDLKLYDFRNRLYQPAMGRFLQPDPVGLQVEGAKPSDRAASFYAAGQAPKAFGSSEFNLYRYCHNDPVNKTDPLGLDPGPGRDFIVGLDNTATGGIATGIMNAFDPSFGANVNTESDAYSYGSKAGLLPGGLRLGVEKGAMLGAKQTTRVAKTIWQSFKSFRGPTKTNNQTGSKKEYYQKDRTHKDVEVYDSKGQHKGSMDPKTGEMYKPPVPGRKIDL